MVKFYSYIDDHEKLKFAVICAKCEGKFVLCKHKMRDTLEFPGGHREAEEFVVDTAERELKEETGAKDVHQIIEITLFCTIFGLKRRMLSSVDKIPRKKYRLLP